MNILEPLQEPTLTDSPSSLSDIHPKKIPFQERAFPMGNIIGVNAYHVNRTALKQRLIEGGYQLHETTHFLIGRQPEHPILVVHWFAPEDIDADLGRYFLEELKPVGVIALPQDFGDVFGAVIGSLFPRDLERAWRLFGTNTLQRYHHLLPVDNAAPDYDSPIVVFATLYRRVCQLVVGDTLLDAGCSFGFLPLVVAERVPALTKVVGVDIRADSFPVIRAIADERQLSNVEFRQGDLLVDDFCKIGQFDTVAVLHVLEHFTEADMYRVLTNLLQVTRRRLIVGVPYEPGEPESVYGHEQLFSPEKLEAVGKWCLKQLGRGQARCEDCAGGLLVIDRVEQPVSDNT